MRHLHLPDKVIGWLDTAAVRAEIDRRWEVKKEDIVSVISHVAQIPEDMVFRDVSDRFKDIEAQAADPRGRPAQRHRRRGAAAGPQQGTAQGRLRSPGRRAAVPRADRRRQDRARQGGRRVPVRRREEDDPRRHVRVSGRLGLRRQADRHAARHRRQRARRRAHQSAEGQPLLRRAARRSREGEPEHAESVPAGVRRRLDDRRPRQARLPQRRRDHHDLQHRRGTFPQADQPARLQAAQRRHRRSARAK